MKHKLTIALKSLALCFVLSTAVAQETPPQKVQKIQKQPQPGLGGQESKKRKAVPAPAVEAPLMAADQAQLDAAERTHFGHYACELNQTIDVGMNPKTPGYVDVKHLNRTFTMKPLMSSTGALRLEDVKGKTLLIQIANKSMLMDVQAGRRMVDACVHGSQSAAMATAALAAAAASAPVVEPLLR